MTSTEHHFVYCAEILFTVRPNWVFLLLFQWTVSQPNQCHIQDLM